MADQQKPRGTGTMKVYLSSTFKDLEEYRKRAHGVMRSLQLDVVAMEHYVARDERPLDQCLADAASADLYVGLFAFRYGYIPATSNDEGRSITELEYRKAAELKIPCLVFLVPDNARWERHFDDAVTGEGEKGERIKRLRAELRADHSVLEFENPDQLAEAVSKSVAKRLLEQMNPDLAVAVPPRPVPPHPRQVQFDLLLLHSPADDLRAAELADALSAVWRVKTSSFALISGSAGGLDEFDALVASSRSTAVLLTASSLTILKEDRERSSRTLGLARDRTGVLLGVTLSDASSDGADAWGLSEVVAAGSSSPDPGSLASLVHDALIRRVPLVEGPEVGLPVVLVAMTSLEATQFFADPPSPVAALGPTESWTARYGELRSHWRPFADTEQTIEELLETAVAGVNEDAGRLQGRRIRLQPYPFDPLMRDNLAMWSVYQGIARNGCIVVVDELSLFHDGIRRVFEGSPLPAGEQVAFVSLSPLDPVAGTPHALIRQQIADYLKEAARRFGEGLDPLCEMGVPERRRLDRWLHGSLPRALDVLRDAARDDGKVVRLEAELGVRRNPAIGRLIAGHRPG